MNQFPLSAKRAALAILLLTGFIPQAARANNEIFPPTDAAREAIHWTNNYFVINGKPTFITSGEMHYARIPRELWRDRLWRVKQMGFNCVQMYVFWNATEPKENQWNFTDNLDLDAWLSLIQEMGMYAIVRVGPYSCAEWEHGGFPAWLTGKPGMVMRDNDTQFLKYTDAHLAKVCEIAAKHQIQKGGNVIMVQLENEHPRGWGTDGNAYLQHLYEKARAAGLDIPLFFSGLHHGADPTGENPYTDLKSPWFTTEFWTGWIGKFGDMDAGMLAQKIRGTWKAIAFGAAGYDYYVVHGGSNFGYSGDTLEATYDYSAPIGEAGQFHNLYGPARRAALFAQTFSALLTSSTNAPDFASSTPQSARVTTRKSPQGEIVFIDNFVNDKKSVEHIDPTASAYAATAPKTGKTDLTVKLSVNGKGEFPKTGDLVIHPHDIRTVLLDFPWTAATSFESIASNILLRHTFGALDTWVLYGTPGDYGEVTLKRQGAGLTLPTKYAFTYPKEASVNEILIDSGDGEKIRLLVMNTALADQTWLVKGKLIVGATFVREDGSAELPMSGGKLTIYQDSGKSEKVVGKVDSQPLPALSNWSWSDAAPERDPAYDDSKWLTSRNPQPMETYDSFQNRYGWYRTTLQGTNSTPISLKAMGMSGDFYPFLNGEPTDLNNLHLKQGSNTLAVFAKITPRAKLYNFIGPIGFGGAKGLWGPVMTDSKPIASPTSWSSAAQDFKGVTPAGGSTFTSSFTLPSGTNAFIAYFPELDNRTDLKIFINGKLLELAKRPNEAIKQENDSADITSFVHPGQNAVTLQVGKTNDKTIVHPKFEVWQASNATLWKFHGGLDGLEETAIIGRVLNWDEFLKRPWNRGQPTSPTLPLFWKSSFQYHPQQWETIGLLTTGLKSGHVWLNGHNLGESPQKIPLHMPSCWLKDGLNELVVFDTHGTHPDQVSLQRYEQRQIVPLP